MTSRSSAKQAGDLAWEAGQTDDAIRCYDRMLLELTPDLIDVAWKKLTVRKAGLKWPGVIAAANIILALDPGHVGALIARAAAYEARAEYAYAVDDLTAALAFNPSHPQALAALSELSLNVTRQVAKVSHAQARLKGDPEGAAVTSVLAAHSTLAHPVLAGAISSSSASSSAPPPAVASSSSASSSSSSSMVPAQHAAHAQHAHAQHAHSSSRQPAHQPAQSSSSSASSSSQQQQLLQAQLSAAASSAGGAERGGAAPISSHPSDSSLDASLSSNAPPASSSAADGSSAALLLPPDESSASKPLPSAPETPTDVSKSTVKTTPITRDGGVAALRKSVKIYVPADKHPNYNFVGRILGPRGQTLKRVEGETGCRIMIRGSGSMRDKAREAERRGKSGWDHLYEALHVQVEADSESMSERHLAALDEALGKAQSIIEGFLIPTDERNDPLKQAQLRELAILNGTVRPGAAGSAAVATAAVDGAPGGSVNGSVNGDTTPRSRGGGANGGGGIPASPTSLAPGSSAALHPANPATPAAPSHIGPHINHPMNGEEEVRIRRTPGAPGVTTTSATRVQSATVSFDAYGTSISSNTQSTVSVDGAGPMDDSVAAAAATAVAMAGIDSDFSSAALGAFPPGHPFAQLAGTRGATGPLRDAPDDSVRGAPPINSSSWSLFGN